MQTEPAPLDPADPIRVSVDRYFALVDEGAIDADDRVELLEGVVVSMAPSNPRHATAVHLAAEALRTALGGRAAIRTQSSIVFRPRSVPEPDVAVVGGTIRDYSKSHPGKALLLVEVADTTLRTDRLSKARIYAAADVPEYWIVNLREDRLEVHRRPDTARAQYTERIDLGAGERVALVAFPDAIVAVADLLPER